MTREAAELQARNIALAYGSSFLFDASDGEWYASYERPLVSWRHVIQYTEKGEPKQ